VLGGTGRNFAAGMSGGIAYVLDVDGGLRRNCNTEMVELTEIEDEQEAELVRTLLSRHAEYTGSRRAAEALSEWEEWMGRFVRVIPRDYKRVLEAQKRMFESGMTADEAAMAAFDRNSHDLARLSGQ